MVTALERRGLFHQGLSSRYSAEAPAAWGPRPLAAAQAGADACPRPAHSPTGATGPRSVPRAPCRSPRHLLARGLVHISDLVPGG